MKLPIPPSAVAFAGDEVRAAAGRLVSDGLDVASAGRPDLDAGSPPVTADATGRITGWGGPSDDAP